MMAVSIPYEQTGRSNQKSRTRQSLIDSTRTLLAQGVTPTIEQAAVAASISRPTAYRYFASQQALLTAAHPELSMRTLLPDDAPSDPLERLELAGAALVELLLQHEVALRAMLRISLEEREEMTEPPALRSGRRILWIEEALSPLKRKLRPKPFRRLVISIAAVLGIEQLVWLVDVAGIERREAVEMMRASARQLLQAAL